jgi:hypothetical protein
MWNWSLHNSVNPKLCLHDTPLFHKLHCKCPAAEIKYWWPLPSLQKQTKFPDDKDRDGPQNVGLLTIKQFDVAASPRIFYSV